MASDSASGLCIEDVMSRYWHVETHFWANRGLAVYTLEAGNKRGMGACQETVYQGVGSELLNQPGFHGQGPGVRSDQMFGAQAKVHGSTRVNINGDTGTVLQRDGAVL